MVNLPIATRRFCVLIGVFSFGFSAPFAAAQIIQQNGDLTALVEITTSLPGTVIDGPVGQGPSNSQTFQDGIFTDLVRVNDGTQRFLATTLGGNVHVLNSDGQIQTTSASPLLNQNQTGNTGFFNFRYGLNSLALHPDFANQGTFGFGKAYGVASQEADLAITPTFDAFDSNGNLPGGSFAHDSVLFEYDLSEIVGDANQNSVSNPAAPRELLRIRQPGGSHNGFDLDFRSDGQLFYSVGDGTANSLNDDQALRLQEAQDLDSVYGKLLRINPDPNAFTVDNGLGRVSDNGQYSIAGDNPYFDETARTGNAALSEVYANGFRSPFRISVNPNNEDEVFLGDVGAGAREEVNRVVAGGNYGWGIREGSIGFGNPFITVQTDGSSTLIGPEFEYSRENVFNGAVADGAAGGGVAVISGVIYEGDLFEGLQGQLIGAELGNFQGSGSRSRIFFGQPDDDLFNSSQEVTAFNLSSDSDVFDNVGLPDPGQNLPNLVTGVFEGFNGEIFIVGLDGTQVPGVDETGQAGDFLPGNLIVARLTPSEPDLPPQGPPMGITVLIGGADQTAFITNGDFENLTGAVSDGGALGNTGSEEFNVDANFAGPVITIDGFEIQRTLGHVGGNPAFGLDNSAGTPLLDGGANTGVFFNNGGVTVVADQVDVGENVTEGTTLTLSFDIASDNADEEVFYDPTLLIGGVEVVADSTELSDVDGEPSAVGSIDSEGVITLAPGENDVIVSVTQTFTIAADLESSLIDFTLFFAETEATLINGLTGIDRGTLDNILLTFTLPADENLDGVISAADYTALRDLGSSTELFTRNFGRQAPIPPAQAAAAAQAVPEPAAGALLCLAVAPWLLRSRLAATDRR